MHDFCAFELPDTETKNDRMQEVCPIFHYTLQYLQILTKS